MRAGMQRAWLLRSRSLLRTSMTLLTRISVSESARVMKILLAAKAVAFRPTLRSLHAGTQKLTKLVGCGSNVVDRFFLVRALPKPGEKGFFARFASLDLFGCGDTSQAQLRHYSRALLVVSLSIT